MNTLRIDKILKTSKIGDQIIARGWVRTFRANRFVALNDGSTIKNLQCVLDFESLDKKMLKSITTGAALKIEGILTESIGSGQNIELQVKKLNVIGICDPEIYPIQPKKHSLEFLREKAHLRIRTNTIAAVMRVRSNLAISIHQFFSQKNFFYIHSPIITSNDAEGAGDLFRVTTLELENLPQNNIGKVDFEKDFFGNPTHLTVSGQLQAEIYAQGLGNVYTFGPTFRAENSNTARHLAEFWMIEPEMAFHDLNDNIQLAEEFIRWVLRDTLENSEADLAFLNDRFEAEERQKPKNQRSEFNLIDRIKFIVNHDFERISYDQAIRILQNSKPNKKNKFKYPITGWGIDLQSEHERFLVEKHFKKPVVIYDYPKSIKAFYMRMNPDDKTVAAMDVLFPGIGEIVGGSQREERIDYLRKRINELNISAKELWWYLELRQFGSVPHSGFGLGFERLVQFVTGMNNIRDVIPFPRTPQNASF